MMMLYHEGDRVATSASIGGPLRIDGTPGADILKGTVADEDIYGNAGDDDIYGNGGQDHLYGGAGDDWIASGNTLSPTDGPTIADSKGDLLDGGAGDDYLVGNDGNDTLLGGDGDDIMLGQGGNDSLDGGSGLNILAGGAGDDHYVIRNRTDLVGETGGHDSGTIAVDWYKTNPNVEDWTWAPGVQKLPYWIDALTYDGAPYLGGMLDANRTIGYAFAQTPPDFFNADDKAGFKPFTAAQMTYTRAELAYVESVANVHFVETTDTAGGDTIVFGNNMQENSAGYGTPLQPGLANAKVMIATTPLALNPGLDNGAEFMRVVTHEIGHALGLKHPFAGADSLGNSGPGPYLPDAEDRVLYTVMSYTGIERNPGQYSPFDIAALQYLYGPSTAYHAGDTVTTIGRDALMLGDGGGNDTIDGSAQTQDLTLFLEAGYWSYVGARADTISASGQITIDIGSVIENAIGGSGNDRIVGNAAANSISGGNGNDVLRGGAGNDRIDGGAGLDTAAFAGARSGYTLTQAGAGLVVTDNSGAEGTDTLVGIERLVFDDGALAFDLAGTAGEAYRLYAAAFDRKPDLAGLGYWIGVMDRGASLVDVATGFTQGSEFTTMYGAAPTREDFLGKLYQHILHRAPDAAGYDYWLKVMQGGATEGQVLADFGESSENQAQVIGQIQDGIAYQPFVA